MNTSALYHRPESEYAFLYTKDTMRIRLRTERDDVQQVGLIQGDPYLISFDKWYLEKTPMKKTLSTDLHDYWEIETQSKFHRLQYGFYVEGKDGTEIFYGDQGVFDYKEEFLEIANYYFRMPYFQEIDRFHSPEWVKDTVWYQIFPERFANGDKNNDPKGTLPWGSKLPDREDFFGGDLQGVLDHLDYLVDLGINGIYFCPIFKATSNHKYDTIDYYEIDPDFGDKKLFKKLVDEAHKRGIRIMLDAVFNHMGDYSPQWQDVIKNGEQSKYADWFHIHSFPVDDYDMTDIPETARNLSFDTFAFTPHMPKLNTANPEVQDYLLDIATYWIREFDIDAWRLDVANEVDHHFWKRFRKEVTAIKEDFYILGEIWHSSQSWLQGDEFHAVMNYAFTDNIKDFFVNKKISPSKMVSGMNHQQLLYRDQTNEVTFNILDSHDTARILTICNGDKDLAKATLAFMFLQKGSPCIYYGTEIGMLGDNDPDCRRCMVWEEEKQDKEMHTFTKKLIQLRKEFSEVITYGDLNWRTVNDEENQILFSREIEDTLITAFFNESAQSVSLDIEGECILSQNEVNLESGKYSIGNHGFIVVLSKK
ncbi:glycoside hydrolase family 13 protein [Enterococcus phoeniculicola]|jgi:cyclomaltodextrinase|uniref:Neopullulanase n=1 Tax=Enterococcus phoeniculicola ATCC BAA-412 TaxID=1158610 RepID=R3TS11_9ENTE|nr:glycoside hydrolase family 13 protein [Enterococcus phoeniculicola]EOL43923.1 neopullulanase [Enterococcus phoeniculicola ATCC BAA-412]EOT76713.1 neopullulanase [Enterococcus phoeniculicola ATCC BAA-412]